MLIVLQSTGYIHICHPSSSRVIKEFALKTVLNGFMSINSRSAYTLESHYNEEEDLLFCVGDSGIAETHSILNHKSVVQAQGDD